MAPMLFAKAIMNDEPINVYNNGKMARDFTYVDDIVDGVCKVLENIPTPNEKGLPYRLFNIGNSKPVQLMDFIDVLGKELNKEVHMNFMPMQEGDVVSTFADTSELKEAVGYQPKTTIQEGVKEFVDWYKKFYAKS